MVWSIRGLSIERILIADKDSVKPSIELLARLLHEASPDGRLAPAFHF